MVANLYANLTLWPITESGWTRGYSWRQFPPKNFAPIAHVRGHTLGSAKPFILQVLETSTASNNLLSWLIDRIRRAPAWLLKHSIWIYFFPLRHQVALVSNKEYEF